MQIIRTARDLDDALKSEAADTAQYIHLWETDGKTFIHEHEVVHGIDAAIEQYFQEVRECWNYQGTLRIAPSGTVTINIAEWILYMENRRDDWFTESQRGDLEDQSHRCDRHIRNLPEQEAA